MGFSVAQAARLTGNTPAQLRSWERLGLVVPASEGSDRYSFRDLVALRLVASLLEAGLSLARIRRALRYLVESGEDVAALSLVTDGESVWACRDDGQVLDALRHGQLALFVAVGRVAAEVEAEVGEFDAERQAFVDELRAAHPAGSARGPTDAAASGRAGGATAPASRHRTAGQS
ncbi:MAG TPA: helix-turn-helix domain-containing protein [Acidimicrobiia bacterium]|nr:helix-turn-helix domain-containing protein [Acidimicrobiia bacterium]